MCKCSSCQDQQMNQPIVYGLTEQEFMKEKMGADTPMSLLDKLEIENDKLRQWNRRVFKEYHELCKVNTKLNEKLDGNAETISELEYQVKCYKLAAERIREVKQNQHDGYEDFVEGMLVPNAKSLEYRTLGLASEAGEVASKVKKLLRDGVKDSQGVLLELGDALFYLVAVANAYGFDLQDVMQANKAKLFARKQAGTIQGNGDKR